MKKCVLICVLALSVVFIMGANAEVPKMREVPLECTVLPAQEIMPMATDLGDPLHGTTECYIPVTYKTIEMGTVTNEVTYYEHVATITFRYYVTKNSLGKYTGGAIVASQGWPNVDPMSVPHLDLSMVTTEEPTGYVVPINGGDGYRVNFYGGCLTITYNAVIYKNINNEIIDADSATITRAFSYIKTGP